MKNLNLILLLFLLIFVFGQTWADQPRHRTVFTSANQKWSLSLIPQESELEEWVMIDNLSKEIKFKVIENLSSKSVLIHKYGMHFIVVDDFSEDHWENDPEVISFFFNDSLLKSYRLSSLLKNIYHVSASVSHFTWFSDKKIEIVDDVFKISTFELTNFTFDIVTGEITDKHINPILQPTDIYVYGTIKKIDADKYKIKVVTNIQGSTSYGEELEFSVDENYSYLIDGFSCSIILRNEKLVKCFRHIVNLGGTY